MIIKDKFILTTKKNGGYALSRTFIDRYSCIDSWQPCMHCYGNRLVPPSGVIVFDDLESLNFFLKHTTLDFEPYITKYSSSRNEIIIE